MSRPVTPVDPSLWVDAAPFAAHLLHLSASSGVPWAMVAAHAHVPLRAAERLVGVPGTRRLRKLPRALAQRLLAIDPVELAVLLDFAENILTIAPYAVVVIECHTDELKRNIVAICVEPLSALATVAGDLSTNGLEFLAFGALGLPAGG